MDPANPVSERVLVVLACAAFAFWFWKNIRFLLQGIRYRRLSSKQQEALNQVNADWHAYHGRSIPRAQLVIGIIVAVVVLLMLALSQLGCFG